MLRHPSVDGSAPQSLDDVDFAEKLGIHRWTDSQSAHAYSIQSVVSALSCL
jgi:hypothetical protein